MKQLNKTDVAVVGGGIMGLAFALEAIRRQKKVTVFERNPSARGASVRNFGMIYPLGMRPGKIFERALRTRNLWLELGQSAKFWFNPCGSLLVARSKEEIVVLEEFVSSRQDIKGLRLLTLKEALKKSPGLVQDGLLGALWSESEICVDPQDAIQKISLWLENCGVNFKNSTIVTAVESDQLIANGERWYAEQIIICSGSDLQTLFPNEFRNSGLVNCQLQMFRTNAQPCSWLLGPMLASGLSLLHYPAFTALKSYQTLKDRLTKEHPKLLELGIHVLVSQHSHGRITVGDSHEYGDTPAIFYQKEIEGLIRNYLSSFLTLPDAQVSERWLGNYVSHPSGEPWIYKPTDGVMLVNGIGGVGMTTGFGLAQEILPEC